MTTETNMSQREASISIDKMRIKEFNLYERAYNYGKSHVKDPIIERQIIVDTLVLASTNANNKKLY